jgi:hypothetical protein
MFTAAGNPIGEFILKHNRENTPYYFWEEKNYFLFAKNHFWGDVGFSDSLGDLATIIDGNHANIGFWRRQLDDTIFVYVEHLKQGYVLVKSNLNSPIIYWATVVTPPNTNALGRYAIQVEGISISGNPI